MGISYHFHFKGSLGFVEGKGHCFNLQAYKAYKMNYLDDRKLFHFTSSSKSSRNCMVIFSSLTVFGQYSFRSNEDMAQGNHHYVPLAPVEHIGAF